MQKLLSCVMCSYLTLLLTYDFILLRDSILAIVLIFSYLEFRTIFLPSMCLFIACYWVHTVCLYNYQSYFPSNVKFTQFISSLSSKILSDSQCSIENSPNCFGMLCPDHDIFLCTFVVVKSKHIICWPTYARCTLRLSALADYSPST